MHNFCVALVLLAIASPVHANRHISTEVAKERLQAVHDGVIPQSTIGTRTHDVLGTFDMQCPHTSEPNPTVLVLLDPQQPLQEGEWIARRLARYGYAAVLLHPRPPPDAPRISAMIDTLLAGAATVAEEPGCAPDGRIGLYGNLRAGAVVLEVARDRELAGHPVDVVVTTLARGSTPLAIPATTPSLLIEASAVEHGHAHVLVIEQLTPCELHSGVDPCWARYDGLPADEANGRRSAAVERQIAIGDYTIAFLRATLDRDQFSASYFTNEVSVRRSTPPTDDLGDPEYRAMYSVPFTLGATFGDHTTFAIALRPEVLFLRVRDGMFHHDSQTIGIGVYGELGRLAGAAELGAGLTLALGSGRFGFAPSLGVVQRGDDSGVAGSLFVGLLDVDDLDHNTLATGARIDARRIGNDATVTVSYQLDLALLAVVPSFLSGIGH